LITQRHPEVVAHLRGHGIDADIIAETKVTGDETR
jgi:hypothetical protein